MQERASGQASMSTLLKASRRVLIVEDDLMVATMVQDIVSKLGYEVVGPAGDQPSANKLIETTRIDAALISAGLLSSAEDSAANGLIARGIPFALITGYGDSLDYGFGQIPLLPKPFTGLQMSLLIEKLLGHKNSEN
jgi:DNA-binding NtrC family response regulator